MPLCLPRFVTPVTRLPSAARVPVIALVAAAGLAVGPDPAAAQIRASEPASVTQTIDGTTITIEYFRPRARGRAPLFGKDAVVWEHIWTPGANWATTIAFEKPIELEGEELEPGTYSMWMVMSEDEFLPEELVLHPEPKIFHTNPPELDEAVLRIPLERGEAEHTEMLTWAFEEVRTDGATLALRWGTTRIPFEVGVESTMRQVTTAEEAAPVVGTWEVAWNPRPGEESPPPFTITVTHAPDGTLHGDMEGIEGEQGEWMNALDLMLLPVGEGIFAIGEAWDGELTEVWPGVHMEFDVADGPSSSLQIRGEEDAVWGEGTRVR